MTDKEKIIAEIERLYCEEAEKYDTSQEIGAKRILDELSKFINSIPAAEEQPSEELEKEIESYLITNRQYAGGDEEDLWGDDCIRDAIKYGAQWQKEQMMKSAIDAVIVNDEMSGCVVDCEQGCLVLESHTYAIGQKLKLLIIKEDEQ